MTQLQGLTLGAPAAERDVGLLEYFVQSETYKALEAGRASVLIGNRGSGKSAIFRYLAEKERKAGSHVIEVSPDNYSYEMLRDILTEELQGNWAKQSAYTVSWKYVIQVMALKELAKSHFGSAQARKHLQKFLRDRFAGHQERPVDALVSYMKRMEGVKIGSYSASAQVRELNRLYKLEELEPILPYLESLLEHNKVIILIDELDRGWDASEDARQFVAGLFQAAIQLNQISKNFRVLISLRRELYDNIPEIYEDAQKVRDLIRYVNWDENGLRTLMAERIRKAIFLPYDHDFDFYWTHIFVDTLDYRRTKTFNYLIDRTLYRPREIIVFCNNCLELCLPNTEAVDYDIVSRAETVYSRDRAQDIAAEHRFQYPGLTEIFETFRGMVYNMTRENLEHHCLSIVLGEMRCPEAKSWLDDKSEQDLVGILWEIGFIRALLRGGQKGNVRSGSRYAGPHQISTLNLQEVSQFHIHPMFRASLGLKEK